MLNELHDLAEAIRCTGWSAPSWHRHYKTCPKGTTFMVLIDAEGRIARIEHLRDIGEITQHRKYEVANGQSFPAFNVPPHCWLDADDARKTLSDQLAHFKTGKIAASEFAASLRGLVTQATPLWDEDAQSRIAECLTELPSRLSSCIGSVPAEMKSFSELVRRSGKIDLKRFADDLLDAALRLAESNAESAKDVVRALVLSSEKDRDKVKKPSLILELADRDSFPYPANHRKVQDWINSQLMASTKQDSSGARASQADAFGQPTTGASEKFPAVKLPILGNVTIRSMNGESPCQNRYGKVDSDSFPVGQTLRQRMKDALEWIGDSSRQGKTWQDVSGACGYDRGLLFAYPSILPAIPEEMSEFAALAAGDSQQEARFESIAEGVVKALRGIAKEHPEVEVRVFALAKADTARTKLLARASPKASDYIGAAELWQEGTRNLPSIRLHLGESDLVEPVTPFPVNLAGDVNTVWIRGGDAADTAQHLLIGDGLRLLLDTGNAMNRTAAKHLLALLRNTTPILLRAGHADHLGDGRMFWKDMEASAKTAIPSLPRLLGALGLLLLKLGQRKGVYMNSSCFAVGQLLALADLLHREYCRNVRQGDIPNQLIGNAIMPIALENPQRAVTRLNDRMMVYQRWAFTSDGNIEGNRLGKWALKRLGLVSAELAANSVPTRADDAGKAQMLLGYLARQESDATAN